MSARIVEYPKENKAVKLTAKRVIDIAAYYMTMAWCEYFVYLVNTPEDLTTVNHCKLVASNISAKYYVLATVS
jgi:hypothetical protein